MPFGISAGAWLAAGVAATGIAVSASQASDAEDAQHDATQQAKASADAATQLGYDQLQFSKDQYNDLKPARDKALDTSQQAAEASLEAQKQNTQLAADYDTYRKSVYEPLEKQIVADSQGYDTADRRNAAAREAVAGVDGGFARVQDSTARQLASAGVNPGSARSIAAMGGLGIEQAKAGAGAAYAARKGVETQGFAREMDAASLGRNLPSSQATSAGLAVSAGTNATNNAATGVATANSGAAGVQAGYNGAVNAVNGAGSLYNGSAANYARLGATQSANWNALGSVAGGLASRYASGGISNIPLTVDPYGGSYNSTGSSFHDPSYDSDESVKTDIQPVGDDEALNAVNATPVKKWRYDPAQMAARGLTMDGGGEHIGPMAQDVNKTMGEGAAPGGKKIDPITLGGVNMKAVQAVDKKVVQLTRKVNSLASMIASGRIEATRAAA